VAHPLSPRSLDLSDQFSHGDLPKFKQSLKGKAFIYLFYCGTPDKAVAWYRDIMERMAPDVIVTPVFHVGPAEAEPLLSELRPIAVEYARRMEWGWGVGEVNPPDHSYVKEEGPLYPTEDP
jgi:hypothetical protein